MFDRLFHIGLFVYVFLCLFLFFRLALSNKKKPYISFVLLVITGALILWLDINIQNIRGLFMVSVNPKSGVSLTYDPNITDVVSNVDTTKTEVNDTLREQENKLYIEPIELHFYKPEIPEKDGQIKAKFLVLVKNKSKETANNIKLNFIVDDGAGRHISSQEWNRFVGEKEKLFDLPSNNVAFLSWTPDMPSPQFYIDHKEKFIQLTLELEWDNLLGQRYKAENISQIKYNPTTGNFYFEIIKLSYYLLHNQ